MQSALVLERSRTQLGPRGVIDVSIHAIGYSNHGGNQWRLVPSQTMNFDGLLVEILRAKMPSETLLQRQLSHEEFQYLGQCWHVGNWVDSETAEILEQSEDFLVLNSVQNLTRKKKHLGKMGSRLSWNRINWVKNLVGIKMSVWRSEVLKVCWLRILQEPKVLCVCVCVCLCCAGHQIRETSFHFAFVCHRCKVQWGYMEKVPQMLSQKIQFQQNFTPGNKFSLHFFEYHFKKQELKMPYVQKPPRNWFIVSARQESSYFRQNESEAGVKWYSGCVAQNELTARRNCVLPRKNNPHSTLGNLYLLKELLVRNAAPLSCRTQHPTGADPGLGSRGHVGTQTPHAEGWHKWRSKLPRNTQEDPLFGTA